MEGVIAKSTGSWYEVWLRNGQQCAARLRGKFRLTSKGLTNPIAVGDVVDVDNWDSEEAIISNLHPRKNYLLRKATKLSSQFQIVASNLDLAVIIATFTSPRTSTGFIDRFLVTTANYRIEPLIVFNKLDLISEAEREDYSEIVQVYRKAGYTVVETSFLQDTIEPMITDAIQGKTTLLFGHSGVGKSTLLNKLCPGAQQGVSDISEQHNKGKHTTTFAQMFKDTEGNRIIDTPGVKEFGLEPMELWRLGHCFKEFEQDIPNCKYNTCLHTHEPQCAILEAFAREEIADFRYLNYSNILEDLSENNPKYDS